MSQPLLLNGKEYISSKGAAQTSGYAQDYIGQLARGGLIDAQRVGGLWYVSMDSLLAYKQNADAVKTVPPQLAPQGYDPETVVSFDGKDYISASRASKLTGYHQDYVGQLARKGSILSRLIGNRWYIEREGLLVHKAEKDKLLAAVQAEAVGLRRSDASPMHRHPSIQVAMDDGFSVPVRPNRPPLLTYTSERKDLFPDMSRPGTRESEVPESESNKARSVPIRALKSVPYPPELSSIASYRAPQRGGKASRALKIATRITAVLTIVIVLGYGFASLNDTSIYAILKPESSVMASDRAYTAVAWSALDHVGESLERMITTELVYTRE